MEGCQPLTAAYSWGGDSSAGILNYQSGYVNNFSQAGGGRGKNRKRRKTKRKNRMKKTLRKNRMKRTLRKTIRRKKNTRKKNKMKQTGGSKKEKYICYGGIGAKGNGTHTEKEFLKVMENGGKNFYFGSSPSEKKKADKKNKELKQYNLDDWLKWSGAIKGKCKPNLLYYSKDNCKECETFFPIWKQLEKEYKNEIFMDHIQEKHHSKFILEKHNVKKIPAIIFIPLKDLNKDGPIIHFKGKKTLEGIKKFIKKNMTNETQKETNKKSRKKLRQKKN